MSGILKIQYCGIATSLFPLSDFSRLSVVYDFGGW